MAALVWAGPSFAQERPRTMPSRDVDIVYNITRAGQTLQERTRWLAAEQTQRVDPPGQGIHFIMNHERRRALLVDDNRRTVIDMAQPQVSPLDPDSTANFTRGDAAMIAGLNCIDWSTSAGGPATQLCLTEDGVLLRVRSGGHTLIEAGSVSYAPVDPALFQIPPDYTHMAPPAPPPG